ncbi:hypothetical protein EV646_101777 [Kribbella antiqua]|uniref:Uncharacterized protein n=1 Tax=Kribbella antiqua TaxID=2512217 RepID=A0A4R2J0W0_9ACTN|nr:hypothetical protein EV646_101777 [Kribbella antiqua]
MRPRPYPRRRPPRVHLAVLPAESGALRTRTTLGTKQATIHLSRAAQTTVSAESVEPPEPQIPGTTAQMLRPTLTRSPVAVVPAEPSGTRRRRIRGETQRTSRRMSIPSLVGPGVRADPGGWRSPRILGETERTSRRMSAGSLVARGVPAELEELRRRPTDGRQRRPSLTMRRRPPVRHEVVGPTRSLTTHGPTRTTGRLTARHTSHSFPPHPTEPAFPPQLIELVRSSMGWGMKLGMRQAST